VQLPITPAGAVRRLYSEEIDFAALGSPTITRASYVEPDQHGRWLADLSPAADPKLGANPPPGRSPSGRAGLAGGSLARGRRLMPPPLPSETVSKYHTSATHVAARHAAQDPRCLGRQFSCFPIFPIFQPPRRVSVPRHRPRPDMPAKGPKNLAEGTFASAGFGPSQRHRTHSGFQEAVAGSCF